MKKTLATILTLGMVAVMGLGFVGCNVVKQHAEHSTKGAYTVEVKSDKDKDLDLDKALKEKGIEVAVPDVDEINLDEDALISQFDITDDFSDLMDDLADEDDETVENEMNAFVNDSIQR